MRLSVAQPIITAAALNNPSTTVEPLGQIRHGNRLKCCNRCDVPKISRRIRGISSGIGERRPAALVKWKEGGLGFEIFRPQARSPVRNNSCHWVSKASSSSGFAWIPRALAAAFKTGTCCKLGYGHVDLAVPAFLLSGAMFL